MQTAVNLPICVPHLPSFTPPHSSIPIMTSWRSHITWSTLTYHRADVLLQVGTHAVVGQSVEAGAQRTGPGGAADHVLQYEVPANQKGHKLAHCDVTVHVGGATGLGNPNAELAVANTCKRRKDILLHDATIYTSLQLNSTHAVLWTVLLFSQCTKAHSHKREGEGDDY